MHAYRVGSASRNASNYPMGRSCCDGRETEYRGAKETVFEAVGRMKEEIELNDCVDEQKKE